MFLNNKFVRYINQNRKVILLVIAFAVFILLIIRALNTILEEQKDANYINITANEQLKEKQIQNSRDTITSNKKVSETDAKNNYELISTFIDYGNNLKIDEAYNLLTDECKENVYPNIEVFKKTYIDIVFKEKMQADIQSWIQNENYYTYLVNYTGDILSTGNYTKEAEFQDYITIDKDKQKLNVNRYIGRKKIDKQIDQNNIKFNINYIDIFKDYEIYNLTVTNLSSFPIILDNLTSVDSTYIETSKQTKVNCSNYEAGKNSFTFEKGVSKNIKLKFYKQYNKEITDEKMIFSKAILNAQNIDQVEQMTIDL